jgi:hypothetical protein
LSLEKKLGVKVISLYGTRETGGIARDGEVYVGVVCRVRRADGLTDNGTGEVRRKFSLSVFLRRKAAFGFELSCD